MGQEAEVCACIGVNALKGKVLLETDYLLFRGKPPLKIFFKDIKKVETSDGWLHVNHSAGAASFELGPRAEKWAEKIRSPKSLLDKLGVKPDSRVAVLGVADNDFRAQLAGRTTEIAEGKPGKDSDVIFFGAGKRSDLRRLKSLAARLEGAAAIWIVYPKGRSELTENDVLEGGKAAGLVDVKVVRFSSTHTGLKFVIPLSRR